MATSSQEDLEKEFIGQSNDITVELARLKHEFGKEYKPLIQRELVDVPMDKEHDGKDNNDDDDETLAQFKLMSFNVLADGLSTIYDAADTRFSHADRRCLHFSYRGFRLIEEITRWKPDVITAQEVDRIQFFKHYLSPLGYKCVHTVKPQSACLRIGNKVGKQLPPDGSAVFFNSSTFALVKDYKFGKHVDRGAPKDIRNLAVAVAHLKHKQRQNKEIIVCSTHFKAMLTMQSEEQRLRQLCYLLPKLRGLSAEHGDIPLFIGCDFNAPATAFGDFFPYAYQSMMNGKYLHDVLKMFLDPQNKNTSTQQEEKEKEKELSIAQRCIKQHDFSKDGKMAQNVVELLKAKNCEFGYGLQLKSAYCFGEYDGKKYGDNPLFTCYSPFDNNHFGIDFILFDERKAKVQVTQLLSTPKEKSLLMPNWEYPSDHLAVMASFKI
eukprot:CAMPEP_0202728884 /NCGR_PEP_ID=MMETSP1385-20130828/185853_1 /ASSEMBLY_ACC=CAM_ASM_000861 /TAXON_ID=933848 /ORGANISM="Elphidium margaritaceum" /LENGTH=435 /DNA_ID=CAMNT_0049395137 /DNA_START=28 /DNA_END=1335 /DNA_ORIENTATION=+